MVFFRLYESPRYLVHAGRPHDAVKSLELISRFNGSDISLELEDVRDHPRDVSVTAEGNLSENSAYSRVNSTAAAYAASVIPDRSTIDPSTENAQASRSVSIIHYASTGETPNLDSRGNSTLEQDVLLDSSIEPKLQNDATPDAPMPRSNLHSGRESNASRRSSVYKQKICRILPRWLRRPLWTWWDRVMMVLTPEWLRTTILVWLAWFSISLGPSISCHSSRPLITSFFSAYTMFNVFLPKLLETRSGSDVPQTLEQSLWGVMIFTTGGCPGAIVGFFSFLRTHVLVF